ncbi:homoserine kinase [Rhodohalobacter sp. SW132]|uniref:homoserine kinase n=1 Tax=Rhodohalobacter sp. SW132 TaxID=2293433 RepID=UPI000E224FA0|nr:homoserine kinase [Rhodohalobacter sp. SW132]REL33408.1 homoserine kinase [Rhodohalobacter sp. SW132]
MSIKKSDTVKAFAPASVANVSCGFDVLALAINEPGDIVEVSKSDKPGVSIDEITGDDGLLPREPIKNTAGRAALALIANLDEEPDFGISIRIHKMMPLGSGMGSSAASSVAAVVALNRLLGDPFSKMDLLNFALEGELAASGSPHADNVSASLLGGFTLIRSQNPLDVVQLHVPDGLVIAVFHPHLSISTKNTRLILRKSVQMSQAVKQWGNVGGLIAGLYTEDFDLISRSMEDHIVEPARSILIPGFDEMKEYALKAGALGFSISGAGPSVFALCRSEEIARTIQNDIVKILDTYNLQVDTYVSPVNRKGSYVIEEGEDPV